MTAVTLGKRPRRSARAHLTVESMRVNGKRLAAAALFVGLSGALATPAQAADYRSTANGACARFDSKTNALPPITSAAEYKRQLVLVPKLFKAMVDTIAALQPPAGKAADASRLASALREVQKRLEQVRDASFRGDQKAVSTAVQLGRAPSARAARSAKALGLPACTRLASTFAKGSTP